MIINEQGPPALQQRSARHRQAGSRGASDKGLPLGIKGERRACVWLTRQQCGKRKRFVKCDPALCRRTGIYGTGRCSSHPFLFKMSL